MMDLFQGVFNTFLSVDFVQASTGRSGQNSSFIVWMIGNKQ